MSRPPETSCLNYSLEEGILHLELKRPPLNILDTELLDELNAFLREFAGSRKVRVLLLSGAGRCFCAGASVEEHLPGKVEFMLRSFSSLLDRLCRFPVPTVVAAHSHVLGGGLELACAADVFFAAGDATLGQPEILLGAIAPGALFFLSRRLGYHRAADLLFSGRSISGSEAFSLGLVDRVCESEKLLEEARTYARQVASLSSPVLREYKQALLSFSGLGDKPLESMTDFFLHRVATQSDYVEGMRAFLEKRSPQWEQEKGAK